MKRRAVALTISDHAVLRYLERAFGVDVGRIRRHLAGRAMSAAELGAVAVQFSGIKLALVDNGQAEDGAADVVATTALHRSMPVHRREKRE
ncbi:MAG: hypothetical protein WAT70_08040 [Rhizobiaceae bacterium]